MSALPPFRSLNRFPSLPRLLSIAAGGGYLALLGAAPARAQEDVEAEPEPAALEESAPQAPEESEETPGEPGPEEPASQPERDVAAAAYERIQQRFPTKDLMTTRDYSALVFGELQGFLRTYPDSPLVPAVEELLRSAEEEMRQVENGFRKVDGVWISAAEFRERRPEIEARQDLSRLQEMGRVGEPVEALSFFEDFEARHAATLAYAEAARTAQAIFPRLQARIERLRREFPRALEERMERLRQAPDRAAEAQRARQEDGQWKAEREVLRGEGRRWLPLSPIHMESLEEAEATLRAEEARLSAITGDTHTWRVNTLRQIRTLLAEGDKARATVLLTTLDRPSYLVPQLEAIERELGLTEPATKGGPPGTSPPVTVPQEPAAQPAAPASSRGRVILTALATLLVCLALGVIGVVLVRTRNRSKPA